MHNVNSSSKKKCAVILGAGPAGLVTAWKLLEAGWDVELYEKLDRVGGMCRSWKWEDFIVDTGPHIYHTPDARLAEFWEQEFGDLFIKGEFWCKNVKGEKFDEYWDYPLSWESIANFPRDLKGSILDELDRRSPDAKARAKNYKEYMEAEVGPTIRKMFFEKYPEKVWGLRTEQMTPEWAPKRVEIRQKVTPFYYNQWNAVGKFGTGCIYERIRDHIVRLGGRLHLNTAVKAIETNGSLLSRIILNDAPARDIGHNDVVVSTLPLPLTALFLGHKSSLKFRGIRSVFLAYDRDFVLPAGLHWLYFESERVLFNRVTESKRLSPFVAPPGKTYLTAEITYSKGDAVDLMTTAELHETVAIQAELVGLGRRSEIFAVSSNKEDAVYPLQFAGYQEELAKTRAHVATFPQLYSIGTGGDFYYADSQVLFHKAFDVVDILCSRNSSFTQTIRQPAKATPQPTSSVAGRIIGGGARCYIIAEAGLNHNGSVEIGKQLIDLAAGAGCDAIKFQTFLKNSRISNKVKAVRYAETIVGQEETLFEMFSRLSMPFEDQRVLFDYARSKGLEIFSTPFDFESVDFLEKMKVNIYKIASMDLVNLPLIDYVAQTGKPMIISTGMSNLAQIEDAMSTALAAGNGNVMLLHCNSSYPAAINEMNLKAIQTLRSAFRVPVGLSDHTFGLFVSHTSIAMGADIIERHFTLDRTMEGPDHILSSEPAELAQLVSLTHQIPIVMGDGIKRIQPSEYATINTQRKSIYARVDILPGQTISADMLSIKGPGGGLLPRYAEIVVGRSARRPIEADFPITWDDI